MIEIIGLALFLVALIIIAFYIVPKQIMAVVTNERDWLTALRWQLLLGFSSLLIASVPSIIIRVLRSIGIEPPAFMLDIAKITISLCFLIFAIMWVLIYKYRGKR